ncbi:MAG: DUF3096 domain-containing protein [Ignisphaera sp.]
MTQLAEKTVQEMLKKYFGVSAPRLVIGVLMIIFGILIIVFPELIAWLIGIYLLVSGILTVVDEMMRGRKLSEASK